MNIEEKTFGRTPKEFNKLPFSKMINCSQIIQNSVASRLIIQIRAVNTTVYNHI